jgi:type IV pilus biogenesis protein CpaD/CtpE
MNKFTIFAVLVALAVAACTDQKNASTERALNDAETVAVDSTMFGESFSIENAKAPQAVLAGLAPQDSLETTLKGTVKEVCKAKGCWMTIDLENGESMRVTFKDYGFFVPKDIAGKEVIFMGQVKYTETDVATLRHYAEDEGKTEAEVLAITSPEQSYNFVATGVKLL